MSFAEGYKSSMGGPIEDKEGLDAIKAEGIKKGRQDAKNAGIKNTVNALSSGTGPMKTSGFGNNFSSKYQKANERWKQAGMHRTTLHDGGLAVYHTKGTETYKQPLATSKYIEEKGGFEKTKDRYTQGTGTDAKTIKSESGAIIENIPGEYGKTRDRAIIYKPTTSTQKQNVGREVEIREAKKLSFNVTPSLRTENLNGNIKSQVKQADKIAKKENVKNKKANKLADKSYNKELKQHQRKKKKALVLF